ncbi:MAG: CCA tRNA nucleotidyltransferase [Lentisphaerae bacterium]|nr:CCA tRNA nucleotidyltransferase [Lentisphaerota bacterium]
MNTCNYKNTTGQSGIPKSPVFLSDSELSDVVRKIANLIKNAGGRAMLVGGCVRDAIRGIEINDYDIEVYGIPAEKLYSLLSSSFSVNSVGASFGVLKIGNYDIDVALPRLESKFMQGHRGFHINTRPDLSFSEAASRRDFTVNSIMADPLTSEIIDPFDGTSDIKLQTLRHVGPKFSEDPLRVLRAMQFAARLEYDVHPETVGLCSKITPENLPAERLAGEWEKLLLKGARPSLGLKFLHDCGWIQYYPELQALIGCRQDPRWHPEGDVWTHTLHAVDALPVVRKNNRMDDLIVAVSVLCHDFGKPKTTELQKDGRITSYGHEKVGVANVRSFIRRMWNMPDFEDAVIRLVATHMRPVALVVNNSSDKAYRKLSLDARRLDLLADVVECDMRATPPEDPHLDIIHKFRDRAEALSIAKEPPKPLIQGRHLIERGMEPGPKFGRILKRCYNRQINGEFADEESAMDFLDEVIFKKRKT